MTSYVEHANITVRDIDEAVGFLQTAMPEWKLRGRGVGPDGRAWLHLGTETTYVALEGAVDPTRPSRVAYSQVGVNHLGFVVEDATALAQRMKAAGYQAGFQAPDHPHRRRVYFYDKGGAEWEFVEYFSSDPAERNAY